MNRLGVIGKSFNNQFEYFVGDFLINNSFYIGITYNLDVLVNNSPQGGNYLTGDWIDKECKSKLNAT